MPNNLLFLLQIYSILNFVGVNAKNIFLQIYSILNLANFRQMHILNNG